jgi:hypothetical protein
VVRGVLGDPWSAALILLDFDTDAPIAWPSAPVLEFGRRIANEIEFSVTATLGPDDATSTADAQANWEMTEEELLALPKQCKVRLAVDGESWFLGSVQCQS